ncbi:MAG: hypothetical protein KatS3mg102_0675 [Planctomycetota bacterium]|nr:MAG: hypothetical protein KatS3mg102_0675 [Planctomycetota bacterium]
MHHPGTHPELARWVAGLVARLRGELEARLGLELPSPLHVHLAPTDRHFEETVRALAGGRSPPAWAQAVAIPRAPALVIRLRGLQPAGSGSLATVLGHELAHAALWAVGPELPRWFEEGIAQWAAGERLEPLVRNRLAGMARGGTLPALQELERDFPPHAPEAQLAYQVALAFVDWLAERGGPERLRAVLGRAAAGAPFARAFEEVFGAPPRGYELVFREQLAAGFRWWVELARLEAVLALAALLAIAAFVRHRRRRRRLLAQMEQAERPPVQGGPAAREEQPQSPCPR